MGRLAIIGASGWIGRAVRSLAATTESTTEVFSVDLNTTFINAENVRQILRPAPDLTVMCLAGKKNGARQELYNANAHLPSLIVESLEGSGAHLVHIGSSAEYGDPGTFLPIAEDLAPAPKSDYGASKLAGTEAVLNYRYSCVLRAFNIFDSEMPSGHVLTEISEKIECAYRNGSDVELRSAGTTRDFVTRNFIAKSLIHAAHHRTSGLFNICSGIGLSFQDIVEGAEDFLQYKLAVQDLGCPSIRSVVGNPDSWFNETGLKEQSRASYVATLLLGTRGVQ